MQEYLTAWMLWYYGDAEYPSTLFVNLSWDEQLEAMSKTSQIKKIVGRIKK